MAGSNAGYMYAGISAVLPAHTGIMQLCYDSAHMPTNLVSA